MICKPKYFSFALYYFLYSTIIILSLLLLISLVALLIGFIVVYISIKDELEKKFEYIETVSLIFMINIISFILIFINYWLIKKMRKFLNANCYNSKV